MMRAAFAATVALVLLSAAPGLAQAAEEPPAVDLTPAAEAPADASDEAAEGEGEAKAQKDPCQDVYDQTEDCEGLMHVPVEGMAEPVAEPFVKVEPDGPLAWLSNDLINWGLLGLASVAMVGAVGFHAASFFYAGQLAEQARVGQIGPSALATTSNVQTALGVGAGAMWVSAAMFGGTALALWAFDPETGAIRLPFFDE